MRDADGAAQVAQSDQPAEEAQYAPRGAESCLKCHDKAPATDVLRTPHALKADARTPFAAHACESCHGASPEHLVKPAEGQPRAEPALVFSRTSKNTPEEQNAVCEGCHTGRARMHWKGSEHQFAGVTCVSCHDIHTTADRVLTKVTQPGVCYDCHKEQRAQSYRPSRHPINEGLTACSDCHNPHGSTTPKLLAGLSLNDTCYNCHADKRGPFLWEHAPVREDCSNCHTPHGSVQPRLLKVRAPWLCQQCHLAQFHPSTFYTGTGLPPTGSTQQLLAKACLNCHSQVHGSNHPSGVRNMR